MNVSRSIRRARFRTDGGNTKENRGLLSNFAEEARGGQVGAVLGSFKFSICATIGARVSDLLQTNFQPPNFTYPTAFA